MDRVTALQLGYLSQVGLVLYGAQYSYTAITNLRKYEEITKKAAEWSEQVADHLKKTRTTQASGALCLAISFITAGTNLGLSLSGTTISSGLLQTLLGSTVSLGVTVALRYHISHYWTPYRDSDGKEIAMRVPLPKMGDYNKAEAATEQLLVVLQWLEYSWLVALLIDMLKAMRATNIKT